METDKEELPREYLDKGHTKDDMDTGICVTENRVCVGGIRAIRRKCFCKKSGSTSKGVEAVRGTPGE